MAGKVNPVLAVLKEIRDELKEHRGILREHTDHLEKLEQRQTESEIRLSTELINVAQAVQQVRDLLKERLDDRDRLETLEKRVDVIERRLPPAAE